MAVPVALAVSATLGDRMGAAGTVSDLEPQPRIRIANSQALSSELVTFVRTEKQRDARASVPELVRRARERSIIPVDLKIDRTRCGAPAGGWGCRRASDRTSVTATPGAGATQSACCCRPAGEAQPRQLLVAVTVAAMGDGSGTSRHDVELAVRSDALQIHTGCSLRRGQPATASHQVPRRSRGLVRRSGESISVPPSSGI